MSEVNESHSLASEILDLTEEYAAVNGQFIEETNSIHYCLPGESGESLLISLTDNSVLWACGIVPVSSHLEAFKQGIRTNKNNLKK